MADLVTVVHARDPRIARQPEPDQVIRRRHRYACAVQHTHGDEREVVPVGVEARAVGGRSEEHTSELQSQSNLVCRLLLEKKEQKVAIAVSPNPEDASDYVSGCLGRVKSRPCTNDSMSSSLTTHR